MGAFRRQFIERPFEVGPKMPDSKLRMTACSGEPSSRLEKLNALSSIMGTCHYTSFCRLFSGTYMLWEIVSISITGRASQCG